MRKTKSKRFLRSTKITALAVCLVIFFAFEVTPLRAQLSAARNLTGTWQSSSPGTYYEMDPFGTGIRQADVTGTFTMDITQQDNQITIALYLNPISWVTDPAFLQEYGGITGAPPVAGEIDFAGTVSSSSFNAEEQGSQLTSEQLNGTFTTDIITATLTGTAETTDPNGIVVTLTSSPTLGPTLSPTSTPSTTNQTLASRFYSNIGSVTGSAYSKGANGNVPLSTGQIATGTEILTGSDGIVAFNPPNQGGTVYLGGNSDAGWVSLTSEPAPDNQIAYLVYPPVSSGIIFPNGISQFQDMLISIPIEAAIAVAVFGEAILPAAAVALVVEGGAFLIPNGFAYIKETVSHLVVVPQGALVGENTEYIVDVSNTVTVVQVINGPVVFIDSVTNNTITVQTNQMLTLPAGQQNGFSTQDLQNDISSFNPASVNQWWKQTANTSILNNLLDQPVLLVVLALAIAIVVTACAVTVTHRKRKAQTQIQINEATTDLGYKPPLEINRKWKRGNALLSKKSENAPPAPIGTKSPTYETSAEPPYQTAADQLKVRFCPNCGNQLPMAKNFCPFCGFNLKIEDSEWKKIS